MRRELVQHSDGSWHVSLAQQETNIAQRLYNATYSQPNFEFMYRKYMSELTNMLYMNRDFEKQTAYFRYVDGSTIHLEQFTSRWTAPCLTCSDFRKCTCSINEGLDL